MTQIGTDLLCADLVNLIMQRTPEQMAAHRIYMREWHARNKEKTRDKRKAYRDVNRESLNARSRAYYEANRDQCRTQQAQYRSENADAIKQMRRNWRLENPARAMWFGVRARAKREGIPFNLDVQDCAVPKLCPVLGLELVPAAGTPAFNSPSLDRIHPAKGYVKGNVIVVSHFANTIKSSATVEQIQAVADFYRNLRSKT